ncbi:unnamed protein product [Aphanomyces euteiches]
MTSIATGFVRKLYRMLDEVDPTIIAWEPSGTHFTIHDEDRLDDTILTKYYRGKLTAFRQQLLNHGFTRDASSHTETYFHESFVRGNPAALDNIVCVPQPKIKGPPRKNKATKDKSRPQPYPTIRKPQNINIVPGSEEETVWKAINHFFYSDDKLAINPASLANIPGFTPSIVQLNLDDTPNAQHNPPSNPQPNPLFTKPAPSNPAPLNPLFVKQSPSPFPSIAPPPPLNPLFQKSVSNPLFQKPSDPFARPSNPLFDKPTTGFTLPALPTHAEPAKQPLFKRNSLGGDQWQHLVSSSVDRFMQFSDTFASPEDTFKFILEERQKLGQAKLPDAPNDEVLFSGLSTQAPDALISFLMGSSVDLLQKSVDTFESQQQQQHADDDGEDDDESDDSHEQL